MEPKEFQNVWELLDDVTRNRIFKLAWEDLEGDKEIPEDYHVAVVVQPQQTGS